MIRLPPALNPSLLLCCDSLTPAARRLAEECSKIVAEGRLEAAEQLARNAEELQQRRGEWIGCAVALLHLSDQCREVGKLGPARRYCERARDLFRRYNFISEQVHNEAMATYALGFLNQLLGEEQEALALYDQALDLLKQASRHWRRVRKQKRDEQCERIVKWIERLQEYVSEARTRGETTALYHMALVCPWPSGVKEVEPATLEIQKHAVARQVRMGRKSFELQPITSWELTLERDKEYYVLEVPDKGVPSLQVQRGDYILIERSKGTDLQGPGVIEENSGKFLYGRFELQPDGIHLFLSDPNKPPRIIGDLPEGQLAGSVVACLKPT